MDETRHRWTPLTRRTTEFPGSPFSLRTDGLECPGPPWISRLLYKLLVRTHPSRQRTDTTVPWRSKRRRETKGRVQTEEGGKECGVTIYLKRPGVEREEREDRGRVGQGVEGDSGLLDQGSTRRDGSRVRFTRTKRRLIEGTKEV